MILLLDIFHLETMDLKIQILTIPKFLHLEISQSFLLVTLHTHKPLLQLSPVVPRSSSSVAQRLITRNDWWNEVLKFGLFQPMRSVNLEWTNYLINIGNHVFDYSASSLVDKIILSFVYLKFEKMVDFFSDTVKGMCYVLFYKHTHHFLGIKFFCTKLRVKRTRN